MFVSSTFLRLQLLILLLQISFTLLLILAEGFETGLSVVGVGLTLLLIAARGLLRNDHIGGFYATFSYIAAMPLLIIATVAGWITASSLGNLILVSWLFLSLLLFIPLRRAYRQFQRRQRILQRYIAPEK